MNKKMNKKSPCYCGSGNRYEQCCRKKVLALRKAKLLINKKEENRKKFIEQYGHIRVPQMVEAWGDMITLVGGSLYRQTRPGNYTFIHAVHDYALLFFGEDYLKKQESIELEKRHPALQWMYQYVEQSQLDNPIRTGAGAAWLRFAYDIFTISDNAVLEEKLKERLLKYKYFQGARHELWTASLFITAGFEINFVDESDSTQKHPEFVATDMDTGVQIAVEAKSKQRRGILGFSDGSFKPHGEEVNIQKLVTKAYKKESGTPLCVVVDTNLPPETTNWDLEHWLNEIDLTMQNLAREGYADPCPANLVLFYNDPSHYMLNEEIGNKSDSLWLTDYVPVSPQNPCKNLNTYRDKLLKAQKQRLHPPVEIPDI